MTARAAALKALRPLEHDEQCAVMDWASLQAARWPELVLLHAIPNAGAGAQRGRAGWLKAEGVRAGVPDLCLPVKREPYSGLYVEMKRVGERATAQQMAWHESLRAQGFQVEVCEGAGRAIDVLRAYLVRSE